jgi:hypothetical protein
MRICRKEARESVYWLRLLEGGTSPELQAMRLELVQEAEELVRIFSAILQKMDSDQTD